MSKNEEEKITYVYGDVCLRKQRRSRQKLLIIELFLDYAKNSTLHGLRYVAERGLTLIEKLFWIITFLISVAFCSYLIKNVYVKWKNSPVIVTVNERFISAGEVPFPSVTICPQIKSKARTYNYTKANDEFFNGNMTKQEEQMLADVSMICGMDLELYGNRDSTNASLIEHIDQVSPSLSEAMLECAWHDQYMHCSEMFNKVYTAEGLCFNMNSLASAEMFRNTIQTDYNYTESETPTNGWSLNGGYVVNNSTENFPKRGSENGVKPDLEVLLLSSDKDVDGLCNGLNSGYKIYIQHPADFPQSSMYYYAALNRQVSSLAISFNLLGAPDALEDYSIEERQCYFPKDRQLFYFKIYTMKNCRAECLSNYTFAMCNCVGYYMPHNNSSQICVENKVLCMRNAHEQMSREELSLELSKSEKGCRCLPSCNTIEYEAEVLKTDFHLGRYLKTLQIPLNNDTKFSRIEMYFKKPRFVSMHRSELFGLTDFVANIGGLLGVFLGFSFLSLIEILYFITLRLGFTLKRDYNEEKRNRGRSVKVAIE